jgi:transposase
MKRKQQGAVLPMEHFREILRLHELGHSQCAIAQSCGIARSTVQDYIRRARAKGVGYEQLTQLSESEAKALLGKGERAPKEREERIDFAAVDLELRQKGVTRALIWQEGIDAQKWDCSYGGFCRQYQAWRLRHSATLRQVYKGGEKLFVDYCGLTVAVVAPEAGKSVAAQVFVACLGASNYTYAEATPTQELGNWIGAHERALHFFGGVPECIVPDNLKSGVSEPCHSEPKVNQSYQAFAEHYGVAILPARPYKPKDKAKVEKAVQEVERQILAPMRTDVFCSFSDLNQAIRERLTQLNEREMKAYGKSRRALFEQLDQPALKPLPTQPFVFARWKSAKVNSDYHIEVERHYYSVPYWLIQQEVRLKLSENLVEVFHDGKRVACHERSRLLYRHTTVAEHMPPEHWEYKKQSKPRFLDWAETIGPQTAKQVKAIFERKDHEEQAFRSVRGLQRLVQQYGAAKVEAACHRANVFHLVGLRRLRSILKSGLETELETPDLVPLPTVNHDNVRGAQYYH